VEVKMLSIRQLKENLGITTEEEWEEYLTDAALDSVCISMCEEGCEVEPDGECPHGYPSLLIHEGLI